MHIRLQQHLLAAGVLVVEPSLQLLAARLETGLGSITRLFSMIVSGEA